MGPLGPQATLSDGSGLPVAPDASLAIPPSSPGFPPPPWVPGPQSTWACSPWKMMSYVSPLKLHCEGLGGRPAPGAFTPAC